jgi:hypothetical protein
MLDGALTHAAAGRPVFPCHNKPGSDKHKAPLTPNGFKDATTDPEIIKEWWRRYPNALIGMPTGENSGFDVVDLDLRPDGRDGFAALPNWEQLTSGIARTPSGGAHLYFRANGVGCTSGRIAPGVDTRGDGGYVIVPPSPGYRWLNGSDLSNLPAVPDRLKSRNPGQNQLPDWLLAIASGDEGKGVSNKPEDLPLKAKPQEIAAALGVIPNDDLGWDDWNRIGMATWRATDGSEEGFAAFDSWSRKSTKYDAIETDKRWKHFHHSPPDRIGAGTLFFEADNGSPGWRSTLIHPEKPCVELPNTQEPSVAAQPSLPETSQPLVAAASSMEIPTWKHGDALPEPPRWLIRNRLPETGVALLAGQWGTGKTFMWLDIAGAVMTGLPWTGAPVYRRGGVLAFTPEGSASIPMRLAALIENAIEPKLGDLHLFAKTLDTKRLPFERPNRCPTLLRHRYALDMMVTTALAAHNRFCAEHQLPLALIVVDTAMAAAGWTDEQDNAEAGNAWNLFRSLSEKTGALVLVVDHFGKNAESGTRGASAKEANSDAVLALLGNRGASGKIEKLRLAMRKLRDGPQGEDIPYRLRIVDMGIDEHGQALTQAVIDWNVTAEQPKPRVSSAEALLQEAFNAALKEHGHPHSRNGVETTIVAEAHVQRLFKERYTGRGGDASDEAKKSAWKRAIKDKLYVHGLVDGVPHLWVNDADGQI